MSWNARKSKDSDGYIPVPGLDLASEELSGVSFYQRFNKTFFGKGWKGPGGLRKPRGFYWKRGVFQKVCDYLKRGHSIRETSRLSGAARQTVMNIRTVLVLLGGEINCECGQPSKHKGWCFVRFRESEPRQAFMKRWHQR